MKRIAIIGASEAQLPLIRKANDRGLETLVFAWEEGAVARVYSTKFFPVSIRDKEKILEICRREKIDAVISVGSDLAMEAVSFVASSLCLPGTNSRTVEICRNKRKMRQAMHAANVASPKHFVAESSADISDGPFELPWVVKPVDRSGSRGVTVVRDRREIEKAVENGIYYSFCKEVIVEELVDGPQYSVEMISVAGKHTCIGLTEEHYACPPYSVERWHLFPSSSSSAVQEQIVHSAESALNAVGFDTGASHTEIRMSSNGPKIIEVGPRLGGDFRNTLILESFHFDVLDAVLDLALGVGQPLSLSIKDEPIETAICWVFDKIDADMLSQMAALKGVVVVDKELPNTLAEGNYPTNSSERLGYVIFSSEERQLEKLLLDVGYVSRFQDKKENSGNSSSG